MLSPAAIHRSASYIAKNNVLSTEQLTFNADKNLPTSSKMLQIPLLAASTVHADHSIVVKIAMGLDKTIGGVNGVDSDVSIMVSDGENTQGFIYVDIGNLVATNPSYSPCFGREGKKSGKKCLEKTLNGEVHEESRRTRGGLLQNIRG